MEKLQHCSCSIHKISPEAPLKLSRRVGLCQTEHAQIGPSREGSDVQSIHCETHVIWAIWGSDKEMSRKTNVLQISTFQCKPTDCVEIKLSTINQLTADSEVYWITGPITDGIKHFTSKWSRIIAAHADNIERGVSVSELNSVSGCNLRAAVHPAERERGSSRDGAVDEAWRLMLYQITLIYFEGHIGNGFCGRKIEKLFANLLFRRNCINIKIIMKVKMLFLK